MDTEVPGVTVDHIEEVRVGVVIKPQSTIVDLWEQCVRAYSIRRFLATKMWVRGQVGYVWATYEGLDREIATVRHLLSFMGVGQGTRVAVISENRYEWMVVHFAVLQLGAHFVGVPTNVTPEEAKAIVRSTRCRVLFVESETSYAAVREWIGTVGDLQHAMCFEDKEGEASYAGAVALAEASMHERAPVCKTIAPDDTALIMFTAGTTGAPKGVMLSHKTVVANISSVYATLGESITHEDLFLSLCPWTVAGALTVEVYQVMLKGCAMCLPPEMIEGFQDLPTVRPSVVVSVALPFQRAYNNIVHEIMNRKMTKTLTRATIGSITESRVLMKKPPVITRVAGNVLLGGFKSQFGPDLRMAIIVGQQLTKDQGELFADLDVFVVNTYGCMEAGGILATDLDVPTRLKALPGVELRVVNDKNEVVVPGDIGEILVEAPHAMQGYFNLHINEDEAKNSLVAYGSRTFVRTGDFGSLTGQWVNVRGHKDVLITLTDGKVIDPLEVETLLCKSPFIKQVFIFGDRRPYVVALVVPQPVAISNHLRKIERRDGVPIVNEREKADCVRAELRRIAQKLPPRSHVRRFAFVDELTQANGFVTNKWGFARQKIEAHYVHYLNQLYDDSPKFFGHAVDDYDDLF